MNRDESYLLDIYEYAEAAQAFIEGMGVEAFELGSQSNISLVWHVVQVSILELLQYIEPLLPKQ